MRPSVKKILNWLTPTAGQFTTKQATALQAAMEDATQEYIDDYWDDLRFPASGLNAPGPTAAPEINTDLGTLTFENGKTEVVAGLAQLPHAWKEGSTLEPHVHWIQPATGNVVWQLEYRLLPAIGAEFPSEWVTVTASEAASTYPGSGNWVQITSLPSIDMTGFTISAMVLFKLSRLGADALDTLAADIDLLEFDIHYQVDTPGSQLEFIK